MARENKVVIHIEIYTPAPAYKAWAVNAAGVHLILLALIQPDPGRKAGFGGPFDKGSFSYTDKVSSGWKGMLQALPGCAYTDMSNCGRLATCLLWS